MALTKSDLIEAVSFRLNFFPSEAKSVLELIKSKLIAVKNFIASVIWFL
jgi:hypothetical protein